MSNHVQLKELVPGTYFFKGVIKKLLIRFNQSEPSVAIVFDDKSGNFHEMNGDTYVESINQH